MSDILNANGTGQEQVAGDALSGQNLYQQSLSSTQPLTMANLLSDKCVSSPHTITGQQISAGQCITLVNVSGNLVNVLVFKGDYQVGDVLNIKPQAEYRLQNGQVFYQKTRSCYRFVVNYTDLGHSQTFDAQSAFYSVTNYTAFNIVMVNGQVEVHGTTFSSQEPDILYFFLDESHPQLKQWSIQIFYGGELLHTLEQEAPNNKTIYEDSANDVMAPTAQFRMTDDYSIYLIVQDDAVPNTTSTKVKKYIVSFGPKLIQPGQAICFTANNGKTVVTVTELENIVSPTVNSIPLSSGNI
jgi:hypothetical protein